MCSARVELNDKTTQELTPLTAAGEIQADEDLIQGVIGSIHPAATYELVVEQVKRAIFLGRFMPGDKLPPERDLAAQMMVSRTTIREAMRVLEGEGLIQVKRGMAGGLIVRAQNELQSREIQNYMETKRTELDHIFQYRIANECMAARLAASRRTDTQLERLETVLKAMGRLCATPELRAITSNIARFRALDSEFHLLLAEASGNPFIFRAVEDARAEMFLPIGKVFKRLEDTANEHHEAIFSAIQDKDSNRASEAMYQHITTSRESLETLMAPTEERS